jgi:glycosyltransferase involved in cell wall biosynthesis
MGLVGGKRALHLCRHLPGLGWKPVALTLPLSTFLDPALEGLARDVDVSPVFRPGPLADLLERVRSRLRPRGADREVRYYPRTGPWAALGRKLKFLAGGLDGLDLYARYLPWAYLRSVPVVKRARPALIYANAGPFSAIHLADALARRGGLPLVLDLRDPWSLEPNYVAARSPAGQRLVERLEGISFGRAARIILNTRAAMEAYREAYAGRIPPERFTFIRNHFDPELYAPSAAPSPEGQPFRIIYYGHLRPTKNARLFLAALARVVAEERLGPDQLEFLTFGDFTAEDLEAVRQTGLDDYLHQQAWVPFTEAPRILGTANLLLDLMGPNHHLQISGKLYDYMACGRRVLCVSPNPEVGEILARTGLGERVELDLDAIAAAIRRALNDRRKGAFEPPAPAVLAPFSAAQAAREMSAIFDEVSG